MIGTFWAFVPALIAILLAVVTKQVYLSLFIGIFVAAMFVASGNPLVALENLFTTMAGELGSNGGILIFLVVLGIFSVLMVKSGGSNAYSRWAITKIKTRQGACLATMGLAIVFSVDDYFNCLTLGSVMRPVTDKHRISHTKLAYLISSTAAPLCIIAPISSWAAAVSGYADGGIMAFIKTIPLNLYALLTLAMLVIVSIFSLDMFKMRRNEKIAQETGDLNAGEKDISISGAEFIPNPKGKVIHMVAPIIFLVLCCVSSMIFSGYQNGGTNIIEMFSNCDSSIALAVGSTIALFITILFYVVTRVVSFSDAMESMVDGFKSMVPAILILIFAWTLCAFMGARGAGLDELGNIIEDGTLNAKAFVMKNLSADSMLIGIIPFAFFLFASLFSFATGTSWGTFGILIPISISVITDPANEGILYLTMAAVLAGAVYGDHVSPISDSAILASSSARCSHIDHVQTQLPYATFVAVIAGISYLITGLLSANKFSTNYGATVGICLALGAGLFAIFVCVLIILNKKGVLDKTAEFSRKKKKKGSDDDFIDPDEEEQERLERIY